MTVLTSAAVLDLWEAGLSMTPAARATLLLEATGESALDDWPVGVRDAALMRRFCTDPRSTEAVADCPECGAMLEVAVEVSSFDGPAAREVTVEAEGYVVSTRSPTVGDLATLPIDADPADLRWMLLERCLVSARLAGEPVTARALPETVVAGVEDALDEADPAADIRLELVCEECGASWIEDLDPVVFAWGALESAARRLATDVHTLARAYGWSEHEILALTPFRRHLYLSAVAP